MQTRGYIAAGLAGLAFASVGTQTAHSSGGEIIVGEPKYRAGPLATLTLGAREPGVQFEMSLKGGGGGRLARGASSFTMRLHPGIWRISGRLLSAAPGRQSCKTENVRLVAHRHTYITLNCPPLRARSGASPRPSG
jgi:hypothetical protein